MTNLSSKDYLTDRLDDQISWYDAKSSTAQKAFKRLRLGEIVFAASIPLLAGFGNGESWSLLAMALLGASIAIITAFSALNQYQENWIQYRTICESLKHEKYLYMSGAKPYNIDDAYSLFVNRVESLISKENSIWADNASLGADASKPKTE